MADRIIIIDALDIVSGEKIRLSYDATTKVLTLLNLSTYSEGTSGEVRKNAYKARVISDS